MRSVVLVLWAVWLVIYWLDSVFGTVTSGPYDMKVESVGRCPKKFRGKETISFSSKLQRLSRSKLIVDVNATLLTSLTDDMTVGIFISWINKEQEIGASRLQVRINLAKKTSQGFKDNYFIVDVPKACSLVFTMLPEYKGLLAKKYKISGCPVPPGNYSFLVDLDSESLRITPVMEYMKVRARSFFQLAGDTLMCIESYLDFVPKKKNG